VRYVLSPIVVLVLTIAYLPSPVAQVQAAPVEAAQTQTVTLAVENMACRICPITVRRALEKVPGVYEATVDFDTKTATVTFDPEKTNVEALIQATTNAGYPATIR
jgi:mercuric ion binding protein